MAVITTRPASTTSSTGVAVTPSGTAHGVTSDDNDATFAALLNSSAANELTLRFGTPTIPAGSVLAAVQVRGRVLRAGSSGRVRVSLDGQFRDLDISTLASFPVQPGEITLASFDLDALPSPLDVTFSAPSAGKFGQIAFLELYLDAIVVPAPSVNILPWWIWSRQPNIPSFPWQSTVDPAGGPETHFHVRVYEDTGGVFDPDNDPVVFDSGILEHAVALTPEEVLIQPQGRTIHVAAGGPYTVPDTLPDGNYHVAMRVAQTIHGTQHWSDWSAEELDALDWFNSNGANILFSAYADNSNGAVIIDATTDTIRGDGFATFAQVQRQINSGEWVDIRPSWTPIDTPGNVALIDYESPNGRIVNYRARLIADYFDEGFGASTWQQFTGGWEGDAFLKCPTRPELNTAVTIDSYRGGESSARSGVTQPLGAAAALVTADTTGYYTGQVSFLAHDELERARLRALYEAQTPLLLQEVSGAREPDRYVMLTKHTTAGFEDRSLIDGSLESFEWVEVGRPQGPQPAYALYLGPGTFFA